MMEEQDIAAIATMARARGVTTILDNSWASPVFQQPLAAGIDVVVHSASKYISGHSDVVLQHLYRSTPDSPIAVGLVP